MLYRFSRVAMPEKYEQKTKKERTKHSKAVVAQRACKAGWGQVYWQTRWPSLSCSSTADDFANIVVWLSPIVHGRDDDSSLQSERFFLWSVGLSVPKDGSKVKALSVYDKGLSRDIAGVRSCACRFLQGPIQQSGGDRWPPLGGSGGFMMMMMMVVVANL